MPDQPTGGAPWWQGATVYQVYPRSFADGNGDGVGDLTGLRRHLDHIADLGVDAVWMSPVFRSPMADNGYDVSDYCDIDPVFGNLATFDALLDAAHRCGLRVLLDWVPNHTSVEHPWFVESRSSRRSPKRDWYYWRGGDRDTLPNNWRSNFGGPAWTWDDATQQWYLHLFLAAQPDLNWNNPEVQDAMHATLRFWLDRGVDGFRMDVIHLIGKDPALPDVPQRLVDRPMAGWYDDPRTHPLLRGISAVLASYPGDRLSVGEVNLRDPRRLASYYGDGDELDLVFTFRGMDLGWDAEGWSRLLDDVGSELPAQAWPAWVLGNHDEKRVLTRVGSLRRAEVLAVLSLTLRGTTFVYAGDELGLADAEVPPDRRVDVVGRDGCRAPIPWRSRPPYGWDAPPWLPFPPEPERHSAEAQAADKSSTWQLYRAVLAARRESSALRRGAITRRDAPAGVLTFQRRHGDDSRTVVVNFTDRPVDVMLDTPHVRLVDTSRAPGGTAYDGVVAAESAVLLRPSQP
ncbi:MAG TPA: alpha-amylase family glycosyl hydrolase [Mycobacteriales bacterium]|nr:alpha-amylase family glycosyl hydrolase [Mycobacteriales bacterium]